MKKFIIVIFTLFIFIRFVIVSVESKDVVSIQNSSNISPETIHIIQIIYNFEIDKMDNYELNLIYLKKKPYLFHFSDEFDDNDISLLNFSEVVDDSNIEFGEYYLIITDVNNNIIYKQEVVLNRFNTISIELNPDERNQGVTVESCLKQVHKKPKECYRLDKQDF